MKSFILAWNKGAWIIINGCPQKDELADKIAIDFAHHNPGVDIFIAKVERGWRGTRDAIILSPGDCK